jgi:toxin ParE1/3/4
MANTSYSYELSQEADKDLQDIFDFTAERFGTDQAVEYLVGLEELFYALCAHPHTGRTRNEIRSGLRSSSHRSHTVFYRIIAKKIRIVRVLHSSRDILRFL